MAEKLTYVLLDGTKSNYEIQVTLSEQNMQTCKTKVLKDFQKDTKKPGFRVGHVPLPMVEEMVQPYYIIVGMLEEVVYKTMKLVLDDNKDIKLIGQPYDFNPEQITKATDTGNYIVSFKVDVYPKFQPKNDTRKKAKIKEVTVAISEEKKQEVLETVRKQYANYIDAEEITEDSVARIKVAYLATDGTEIAKKSTYLGDHEYKENPELKKSFLGKKTTDTVEFPYDAKLPDYLKSYPNKEQNNQDPDKVVCTIADIKKMELPELSDAFVQKVFGEGTDIKTKEDLLAQIEKTLLQTQEQEILQKNMDAYLEETKSSFDCTLPKTFIEEEYKGRMEELTKQLGGEKGREKFFGQMGEEKAKAYQEDMKKNTEKSLVKYFVLKKIIEELGYDAEITRERPLDAEKKLYEKVVGLLPSNQAEGKKEEKKKTNKALSEETTPEKKEDKKPAAKKAPTKAKK